MGVMTVGSYVIPIVAAPKPAADGSVTIDTDVLAFGCTTVGPALISGGAPSWSTPSVLACASADPVIIQAPQTIESAANVKSRIR